MAVFGTGRGAYQKMDSSSPIRICSQNAKGEQFGNWHEIRATFIRSSKFLHSINSQTWRVVPRCRGKGFRPLALAEKACPCRIMGSVR